MRVATDKRESAEERQLAAQSSPRLGGTDLFRGAMVILVAVVIGGLVLSRGIDDDEADSSIAETEQAEIDPAAGGTDSSDTDTGDTDGVDPNETDPATESVVGADTSTETTTDVTDPAQDPMSTDSTGRADTATDPGTDPGDTTDDTANPLDTVRAPAEVRTLVLNAGGPQGIAGRATELLQGASYITSAAKNADVNGPSAIYHLEGYEAEALALASVFGPGLDALVQPLDTANPPTADLQEAAVIVVVGNDGVIAVP